ncbi:ubiquinone biosynthesis mitochondrial [Chlorella sorokiniana]|uniref:Ubiquinone biosynthesis protein n=1 Tax=Chlorella sorokiniana TaxID=3076 RepID=A0A2P6TRS3_CHLSO|nr:ubiquinone biosynthesis mitochondrial [Chlorella sorokiniana]|eukprot:PRW56755.1 ubiquinone biosynthesis mitochondrial [Chlorella sorokiniana]
MLRVLLRATRQQSLDRLLPVAAAALPAAAAAGSGGAARQCAAAAWQQQLVRQSQTGATPGNDPEGLGSGAAGAAGSSATAGGHEQAAAAAHQAGQQAHEQQHHAFDQHAYDQYAYADETDEQQQHYQRAEDDVEFQRQRQQLLAAALKHVPLLGWSGGAAAAAAAAELGLSPAAAGMLGSDAQLVQLFVQDCNRRLEVQLGERQAQLEQLELRERLREGLQARLQMLEPYMARWPQALSLLAQPAAAPRTLALYAELADAVWHASGDTSTDLSWYTKRALLVGVYSATELYMVNDCSPGYADTWAALDRRLGEALELGKATQDASTFADALGGAAGAVLGQIGSLLGGGRRPGPPL